MTVSLKSPAFILTILGSIVLLVGTILFLQYINEPQDTRKDAAVAGGTAEIGIRPTTLTLKQGDSSTVNVTMNTKGSNISGTEVKLTYTYSGNTVPVNVTEIKLNPLLANWTCPRTAFVPESGTGKIEFSCVVVQGYTNNAPIDLFSFKIAATDTATPQTITFSFSTARTTIYSKTSGEDIAAIPTNSFALKIDPKVVATPTPTPTPTTPATPAPTPTPTATPALLSCNSACTANRQCSGELTCINGACRDYRCSKDTTCGCDTVNVASQSGTTSLPETGFDQTATMFMLGILFLLGGTQLFYTFAWSRNRTEDGPEFPEDE